MSDSLQPHGLRHASLPSPSPTPGACSNSCPSTWWYHPTISSFVIPFSSCLQFCPASGCFPVSQFFTSGAQSTGASASASVLPMNIQDWFPLELTDFISLQSTAAAKSLQPCPALCDPIGGSPPGSPIPGILQARTLEWVAISFSNAWKWKVKVKMFSRVRPSATPWTAACQAPLSFTISQSLLKLMSVELVTPSNHLTSPPSPFALSLSQHQGLFQWVDSSYQVAKVLELQHQFFQWIFRVISFRMDWLDLLAV